MNLKKNLLKVFSANFIQTLTSILVGFIVPSILTIEGYADTLYMTYVGVLHLGFVDGLYLKYGGKNLEKISKGKLKGEHTLLIFMQLLMTIIFLIVALINQDMVLFLMTISILPTNLVSFHKQFYQAVGNFTKYSRIMNIYSFTYVIFNLALVFLIKSTSFEIYCLTNFICNTFALIYSEYHFYKLVHNEKQQLSKESLKHIKSGFMLMSGNLAAIFLYSIDKWFVKLFFTVEDFSYYSFAVSMFNIIVVILNSVSITFYNVFAKEEKQNFVAKVKDTLLVLGAFASAAYFPLAVFLKLFLAKYTPSLTIIALSFATFPYLFIIKAIFVNLYKSRKKEKKYTKVVVAMLIVASILNALSMIIYKDIQAIAIATLLSFIIWYIVSFYDFGYLKSDLREISFLLIATSSFIICSHLSNIILGGFIYLVVIILSEVIIYRKLSIRTFKLKE